MPIAAFCSEVLFSQILIALMQVVLCVLVPQASKIASVGGVSDCFMQGFMFPSSLDLI
jgi:hypothetical protein